MSMDELFNRLKRQPRELVYDLLDNAWENLKKERWPYPVSSHDWDVIHKRVIENAGWSLGQWWGIEK